VLIDHFGPNHFATQNGSARTGGFKHFFFVNTQKYEEPVFYEISIQKGGNPMKKTIAIISSLCILLASYH